MYSPRAFVQQDPVALDALFAHDPFVTLVSGGGEVPQVSHLPVLYRRDADGVLLEGHWARPNPQATGGAALITSGNLLYGGVGILSFALGIGVSFLEMLVMFLQAYVFTLLSSLYIGEALAEEH